MEETIGIITIFGVGIAMGMYISSQIKCHIRSNINRKNLINNLNKEAKEYLDEYLENNDDEIKTIDEYQECFGYLDDLFQVRIYDLAQYQITNELLKQLKK